MNEDDDLSLDRRRNDEKFKQEIMAKLRRIENTLFDEDGSSKLRALHKQQEDMHGENAQRIGKLERAMFTEDGNSRMLILERGQDRIVDFLGKGKFLTAVLIGVVAFFGPIGGFVLDLLRFLKIK